MNYEEKTSLSFLISSKLILFTVEEILQWSEKWESDGARLRKSSIVRIPKFSQLYFEMCSCYAIIMGLLDWSVKVTLSIKTSEMSPVHNIFQNWLFYHNSAFHDKHPSCSTKHKALPSQGVILILVSHRFFFISQLLFHIS